MTSNKLFIILLLTFIISFGCSEQKSTDTNSTNLHTEFKNAQERILKNWYPLVIDSTFGGYYSEVTNDFKLGEMHNKMVVSQSRHLWTNSKAAQFYPDSSKYLQYAAHGFQFLKDVMWDSVNGGFHSLVTREGKPIILSEGQEKSAYGNAFAIYGLATYYQATRKEEALTLAKKTFHWLEDNSHDPVHKS